MAPPSETSVNILGVRVRSLKDDVLIRQALQWSVEETRRTIMYANVHVLNTAYGDTDLRHIINAADLVYCDGEGVRLASKLLNQRLPERMTGADFLLPLCRSSASAGARLFWLGSREGVAERARTSVLKNFPDLSIGVHHGYLTDPDISQKAIKLVNEFKPGIVLVGMGTPIQEKWVAANRDSIEAPVVWAVGALFDYFAGVQSRGPQWLVSQGLEWAYRLYSDPKRLWKRYILGNPLFMVRVLRQKLGKEPLFEP